MSAALMRSECRKFAPNIFNKSKCTNCFRQKEEHSAEALESNRATRKVAKYGYLFVAPGWDFSNPVNRTKRWQRRWFVLYDDGELSYSVDEHPETVPQASIDMTKVLEVADAEEVTGNTFSLAITAPDRVHFVKGTCREEYRSWSDVLSVFPRSKGRHKRNATFPGGQSTSIHQPSQTIRASTPQESRPRFNSCHSEPHQIHCPVATTPWLQVEGDVYPTRDISPPTSSTPPRVPSSAPVETRKAYHDQPASSASPPTRDKIQSEDKARTRRVQNREKRGVRSGRSFSEDFSGMLPSWQDRTIPSDPQRENDVARRILFDYDESKRDEKLKDIADSITRPRFRRHQGPGYHRGLAGVIKPTRDSDCSEEDQKKGIKGPDQTDSAGDKLVRGDPDGCGLDLTSQRYSPSSELRVDLPAEDLLNIKKGWLMKQGLNKEFNKHWFVLRGSALTYYRDPSAEDKGILDGVLDLSGIRNVTEVQVVRNYGFQATTWDDQRYVLSAVTAGIRNNWMSAIRRAAGLQEVSPHDGSTISVGEKLERELDTPQGPVCSEREPSIVPSTPHTPRSVLFSSDEEYRTASEGGRRESEDWGEPLTPLPPSPPLNRTPISRVKEKARSRVYKRSRSSPPSSRRSTLDSVRPDDLLLACCGEVPESDAEESTGVESIKSSLFDSADSQCTEIEDLKRQLNNALLDVGNAEKELLKLRHHKSEITALEKQVKDLLTSLQHTEMQLEQRTLEVAELEKLKQNYKLLLHEHEELLARWREHSAGPDWRDLYHKVQERYHLDAEEWQKKLISTEAALEQTSQVCERLSRELSAEQTANHHFYEETVGLKKRLARGIEENENLYRKLREHENRESSSPRSSSGSGCFNASRERGRSVDSLSDLTNIDLDVNPREMDKERLLEEYEELRGRFEKAIAEIRAMKRELRESHALYDDLELVCFTLRQEANSREGSYNSESSLMVSRIDDLTLKLNAAEKQVRSLKQKLTKSESREKRRSLSLKGRESFQICKELEEKLGELETKIIALETGKPIVNLKKLNQTAESESQLKISKDDTKEDDNLKVTARRLRRKSLDSATSSEPMKVLIRLSSLEAKVRKATEKAAANSGTDEFVDEIDICQEVAVNVESPHETPKENRTPVEGMYVKQLEDIVAKSCDKIHECLILVSSIKTQSPSHVDTLLDNFVVLEKRLSEVKDLLQECNVQCAAQDLEVTTELNKDESLKDTVHCVVSQLESMLRTKLSDLLEKRKTLRETNSLNREMHIQLLAEKLAYETVLVQRIAQAVSQCENGSSQFKKWVMDNEILQSTRLISALKSKLSGKEVEDQSCESSVEYLTKILMKKLLLQRQFIAQKSSSNSSNSSSQKSQVNYTNINIIRLLLKRQQELDACVCKYKTSKLNELAEALANETLSCTEDQNRSESNQYDNVATEDRMIREAWTMAQEAVNRELIQAEISHVTMRCGQLYEMKIAAEQEATFSFLAQHRSILEQWSDEVEHILHREMESGIEELINKYEQCVEKWKKEGHCSNKMHNDNDDILSRKLLAEFADVMAHKALIDARIALLLRETPSTKLSTGDNEGEMNTITDTESLIFDYLDTQQNEKILMGTEFEYLFQQFTNQCVTSVNYLISNLKGNEKEQEHIDNIMKSLLDLEAGLNKLQKCVMNQRELSVSEDKVQKSNAVSESATENNADVTWDRICSKCSVLHSIVTDLTNYLLQGQQCQRCQQLQVAVRRLREQHEEQIQELQVNHEKTMNQLRCNLEQKQNELVCKHKQETEELKEKAHQLQLQLNCLDTEYNEQVTSLKNSYEKTIASGVIDRFDDKNIHHRYQYEVEHLKALCEKGLEAMEKSHQRLIAEMEEKHQQELDNLRREKDQALAEETQATLAALDVMRKAHETEVQKEIAKFKAEFVKKMQHTKEFTILHKEHVEEIEAIKQEILSLSEKYSNKCVESATLEEQLAMAHQHISQLDARNRKLRAQVDNTVDAKDQDCNLTRKSRILAEVRPTTSKSTVLVPETPSPKNS